MEFVKKAAAVILSVCGVCWGQTPPPVRQVSGVGAQASGHTGPVSLLGIAATAMDVQAAFNENSNLPGMKPTILVVVTLTEANGQKVVFSSTSLATVSYWIGSNGSLNIQSTVAAVEQTAVGSTSGLNVDMNLAWSTTSASQKVTAHDTYNQPGYSMTQILSGDLQQTTVSGAITVNGIPVPLAGMPSYWNTSNTQIDWSAGPTALNRLKVPADSSGCSGSGYWTGYWTWNASTQTWYWTWVWVWCSGSYQTS